MKHWKNLLVCLLAGVLALGVLTACSGLGSVNTGTDAEKAAELARQLGVAYAPELDNTAKAVAEWFVQEPDSLQVSGLDLVYTVALDADSNMGHTDDLNAFLYWSGCYGVPDDVTVALLLDDSAAMTAWLYAPQADSAAAKLLEENGDELLVRFSVTDTGIGIAPETLAGITAAVDETGGTVTYDGLMMDFGLLANGRLAPAAGPAVVAYCWSSAYLAAGGEEDGRFRATYENAMAALQVLRDKFGGSALFAREKDESFKSTMGAIYQTFGGRDLYPSVEEKAANLLYLTVKNHSFSDGNKRIAAFLFLWFLENNRILYRPDGSRLMDRSALPLAGSPELPGIFRDVPGPDGHLLHSSGKT
jgi:hypothetical protein